MYTELKTKLRTAVFAPTKTDWNAYWRKSGTRLGGVGISVGKTNDEVQATLRLVTQTLDLKSTDVLLDVGCGDGTFSSQLPCKVLGVDLPEVVAHAVIPTIAGDLLNIPVDEPYEKVLVSSTLHCSIAEKDVPAALKELYMVGKKVFLVGLPDISKKQWKLSQVPRSSLKTWNSAIWFSPEKLIAQAEKAGFKATVIPYTEETSLTKISFNLLLDGTRL